MPDAEAAASGAEKPTKADDATAASPQSHAAAKPLLLWWLGLLGIGLIGGALSLQAYREGLPEVFQSIPQLDKALHFSIGGAAAFFLDIVLRRRMLRIGSRTIPLAAVMILVPAGIEEYFQRYSDYRSSSIFDFTADVLGVVFFLWLSRKMVVR